MPSALAPIRVVRFVTRLNIGGPSIQVVELASRLSARGFETLLIHGEVGPQEGDMSYLLECAASPPRTKQLAALKRPISPASDARAAWKVYRLLCEFKPAIVHTHMAKAGAVGRLAALAYNNTARRRARATRPHLPRPRARGVLRPGEDAAVHRRGTTARRRDGSNRRRLAA